MGTPGGAPCERVGSGPGARFCGCEFHARSRNRATAEAFQTCRNDLEFVAQLRGPSAFQRIGAQALAAARSAVAALPPSALDASSRLLTWPRRPDVGALADVLVRVGQRNKRRLKVSSLRESLPAQWDVRSPRHASAKLAVVSIQLGARTKRSAERGEPLFCAVVFGPARAGDEDHEAAAKKMSELPPGEGRRVALSVLRRHAPAAVASFEHAMRRREETDAAKAARAAAKAARKAASERGAQPITSFFHLNKGGAGSAHASPRAAERGGALTANDGDGDGDELALNDVAREPGEAAVAAAEATLGGVGRPTQPADAATAVPSVSDDDDEELLVRKKRGGDERLAATTAATTAHGSTGGKRARRGDAPNATDIVARHGGKSRGGKSIGGVSAAAPAAAPLLGSDEIVDLTGDD